MNVLRLIFKNTWRHALRSVLTILGISPTLIRALRTRSIGLGGLPVFGIVVGLAFLIQWLAFIPAYAFQTEKFFDFTGSLTTLAPVRVLDGRGCAEPGEAYVRLVRSYGVPLNPS